MKITTYIGDDGILNVELPAEFANEELEIVIVFQRVGEKSLQSDNKTLQELGYSRKFLEEVIGSWKG